MGLTMHRLDTFYQSKEWTKLMAVLKMERVNADGQLICEYCGKPITKTYDAIGHHTEFLTEENVNDADISLNPERIQIVHHVCHNKIHDKFGYKRKEIFLVYGPPLSGKTTYVQDVLVPGDLVIDMDSIWQCITGLPRYQKPGKLRAVAFGMRDYLMDAAKVRNGKWQNAYIVGGFPLISERERIIKTYGAREVFIDVSKEECMARLAADQERDKEEWTGYIDEWFRRYTRPVG